MNILSLRRRSGLAVLGLLLAAAAASAEAGATGPAQVESFNAQGWSALRAQVERQRRPALVVFSATWCSVCPGHIQSLAADARRQRHGVPLWVVLTDAAPGEADARLLATPHLRLADRVLGFDAPEAALRHAVDPRWRGMVPHIAWLAPGAAPEFVAGLPDAQRLTRWLGRPQP